MFNPFKKRKQKPSQPPLRKGIPTAGEIPRIASTVTTRLSDDSRSAEPATEPEPQAIPASQPAPPAQAQPPLPGPDVLPVHTPAIDAKFSGKTPEELCGVDPTMPVDEIRARLAKLFTRHNRAASSFDLELRAEAEIMLQAIVLLREKYIERL